MRSAEPDPAEAMRQRLQTDLRAAIKGRAALDVTVLRGLIAAIDNAGAVPPPSRSEPLQYEVERLQLGEESLQAVLRREHEAYRAAASEFARLGRTFESEQANLGMAIATRYLASPPPTDRPHDRLT